MLHHFKLASALPRPACCGASLLIKEAASPSPLAPAAVTTLKSASYPPALNGESASLRFREFPAASPKLCEIERFGEAAACWRFCGASLLSRVALKLLKRTKFKGSHSNLIIFCNFK
jgi:hypothetical protein